MELQTEPAGFGLDPQQAYCPSMFTCEWNQKHCWMIYLMFNAANEIFPPDEAGLDFLFSPHGVWSGESLFGQDGCIPEIHDPVPFTPYDTPLENSFELLSTAQSTPKTNEETVPAPAIGQKRKRSSTSKAPSSKKQMVFPLNRHAATILS